MSPDRHLAFLGVLAAPAIVLGVATSGSKDNKSNSVHIPTSEQTALDIRNCISTTLPHKPDISNPYCFELLDTIYVLSRLKVIQDCDEIPTILDTQPTNAQVETLRDCASASYIALKNK